MDRYGATTNFGLFTVQPAAKERLAARLKLTVGVSGADSVTGSYAKT